MTNQTFPFLIISAIAVNKVLLGSKRGVVSLASAMDEIEVLAKFIVRPFRIVVHYFKPTTVIWSIIGKRGNNHMFSWTNRVSHSCDVPFEWIAHYMIGIMFVTVLIVVVGKDWLQPPILITAMVFGLITVSMPYFIRQLAFGLGCAASKTSNPAHARLRSFLINHTVFGFGLYLFGLIVSWLLGV